MASQPANYKISPQSHRRNGETIGAIRLFAHRSVQVNIGIRGSDS